MLWYVIGEKLTSSIGSKVVWGWWPRPSLWIFGQNSGLISGGSFKVRKTPFSSKVDTVFSVGRNCKASPLTVFAPPIKLKFLDGCLTFWGPLKQVSVCFLTLGFTFENGEGSLSWKSCHVCKIKIKASKSKWQKQIWWDELSIQSCEIRDLSYYNASANLH